MLYYIFLVLTFCIIFYVGQVIGLKIQCENCKRLSKASSATYIVPLLVVLCSVSFLKESIHNKSIAVFVRYLKLKDKSFIALCACAEIIDEIKAKTKTKAKAGRTVTPKKTWLYVIGPVKTANRVKAALAAA